MMSLSDPIVIFVVLFLSFGKFLLAGLWVLIVKASKTLQLKRIYCVEYGKKQLRAELFASWAIPVDGIVFALAIYFNWFKIAVPTFANSAGTFLALLIFFEFWFYGTHRLMHTKGFFPVHAEHHLSVVTSSWTGLRFSFTEKGLLTLGSVGFAVAASWFMPITIPGILLFFFVYYAESILGHANVEFLPASFVRSSIGRMINTPTFHAMHHARVHGHYGLFTTIPDHLFGTVFPDYPAVHERAINGNGLRSSEERVPKPL